MTDRTDIDVVALKKSLRARHEELQALVAATGEASRPVELDQTRVGRLSRIDALQSQEMAKETERRRVVEINRIEAALKRMDEGDYGYCIACDEEIAAKRLEQDPATPLCVDCAAKAR